MAKDSVESSDFNLKQGVRKLLRTLHPDVGGTVPPAPQDGVTGISLLNTIITGKYDDTWLDVEPGTPVLLHNATGSTATISRVPSTPEQFVRQYEHFLLTGKIINFPPPPSAGDILNREMRDMQKQFDQMVIRLRDGIVNARTIDELAVKAMAKEMVDPSDLHELQISELIDARAYALFLKEMEKSDPEALGVLRARIQEFPFNDANIRAITYDHGLEALLMNKMRRTRSADGLKNLRTSLAHIEAMNPARGEEIRKKVAHFIEKKLRVYFPEES